MAKATKLPEGYGTGAQVYAKAGEKYSAFISRCMKSGKSMKACAAIWKKGPQKNSKAETSRRKRAAKALRTKEISGYGGYSS